jgi:chromosomal replication initiator protein
LARNIRSNVRELEGALVRVMAHASLSGTSVTVDYVRRALGDVVHSELSELSIEAVQRLVGSYFGIRVSDLKGKRRLKELVRPRQLAMFLCRKHLGLSYPELGSRFGNKDHTTVMSACVRVEENLPTDGALRLQLDELERRMESSH